MASAGGCPGSRPGATSGGCGPVAVVDPPLRARQERRVGVAGAVFGEEVGGQEQDRGRQDEVAESQEGNVRGMG